jgi:DNA-binding MarR family transcriptional regulator
MAQEAMDRAVASEGDPRSARENLLEITEFCRTIVDLNGTLTSQEHVLRIARVAMPPSALLLLRFLDLAHPMPVSVSQLASAVGLHPSTISSQLRPLVEKRFIRRTTDREDRRIVWLAVTPSGRTVIERVREAGAQEWGIVLANWSNEDRAALAHLLERARLDLVDSIYQRASTESPDG